MNKKLVMFLICLALSIGLVTWLTSLDEKPEEPSRQAAPEATIAVAEEAAEAAVAEGQSAAEESTVPLLDISEAELEKMKAEAEAALSCCRDVYQAADKGTASNAVLSDASIRELTAELGRNGYSAVDFFGSTDMQNAQAIIDFGNAINAGMDAQAVYYIVHSNGSIHANNIIYRDGIANTVTVSVKWDDDMQPRVYSSGQHPIATIKYTAKGWLILSRDTGDGGLDWAANGNAYTFVRVAPYGDDKRQLAARYLGELPYSGSNLFTVSWDSSNYGLLDLNSIFISLYSRYYGTSPLTNDNMQMITGFQPVSGTGLHTVPYEQFETVISNYINIDSDTIRWLADDSDKYGGYLILGSRQEYYNNITPKVPSPEITEYWSNSDGSITMKIDAVYPGYNTDCAFTHELTVMDTEDGFKYISNYVYDSESNIFPEQVLTSQRKNEIASLN